MPELKSLRTPIERGRGSSNSPQLQVGDPATAKTVLSSDTHSPTLPESGPGNARDLDQFSPGGVRFERADIPERDRMVPPPSPLLQATVLGPILKVARLGFSAVLKHASLKTAGALSLSKDETRRAVDAAIRISVPEMSSQISFRSELESMISRADVSSFLLAIHDALAQEKNPNVWAMALDAAGTERDAERWLAVLFSDLIGGQIPPESLGPNGALLVETRFLLKFRDAHRFPFPDGQPRDRLYHYFVIRETMHRLIDEGFSPQVAAVVCFHLNTEYELSPFSESSAADLYMGYRAVCDILSPQQTMNFEEFSSCVNRDRAAFLRAIGFV